MWVFVVALVLLCCGCDGQVTCKNYNNVAVDWFILYKGPRMGLLTGNEYIYMDLHEIRRENQINAPDGVLANTLRPLFIPVRSMPSHFGFIVYSDQPPGCHADSDFGHSKGLLMINKNGDGVWLLHSTPQFPYRRDQNNFWPRSGVTNAQTFICVTFPYIQFMTIGKHLQHIQAFPYQYDIPDDFHQELRDAVNWRREVPSVPYYNVLRSKGNNVFFSFAKITSASEDGDLYSIITQSTGSSLFVQTWGCQSRRAPSYCPATGYNVYNVKSVKTPLGTWDSGRDHSKWCVSRMSSFPLFCVADMNRADTQYLRTGGALCFENSAIRDIFRSYVTSVEDCLSPQGLFSSCLTQPGTDF